MLRPIYLTAVAGLILGLIIAVVVRRQSAPREVLLADGRLMRIEAVTFGTNHAVGINSWWTVPLRKVLPNSFIRYLTPAREQSRQTTDSPAVVVWVYARDPRTGKYVDCQRVRASFIDAQGDVYPPTGLAHGGFDKGFNRQAYIFEVFPRRPAELKLELVPSGSERASTVVIPNPGGQAAAAQWTPERLPAMRRIEGIDFKLASLTIQTNGGPAQPWMPTSLHWLPQFSLEQNGTTATQWEQPEWEAEDPTGNRGQTLGLHEPLLKFMGTAYPKPGGVIDEARKWLLPITGLPAGVPTNPWNTNRDLQNVRVTVIGLFPAGSYTFSEGNLTNVPVGVSTGNGWTGMSRQVFPGRWQTWVTHRSSNETAFLRWTGIKQQQRIAVGLNYQQGIALGTSWGHAKSSAGVSAYVFDPPPEGAREVALEIVLLEPLHAEFVVRTPATGNP